jgi:hypothetical protein
LEKDRHALGCLAFWRHGALLYRQCFGIDNELAPFRR